MMHLKDILLLIEKNSPKIGKKPRTKINRVVYFHLLSFIYQMLSGSKVVENFIICFLNMLPAVVKVCKKKTT